MIIFLNIFSINLCAADLTDLDTAVTDISVEEVYTPDWVVGEEHMFTADYSEKTNLVNAGRKYEGIAFYALDY